MVSKEHILTACEDALKHRRACSCSHANLLLDSPCLTACADEDKVVVSDYLVFMKTGLLTFMSTADFSCSRSAGGASVQCSCPEEPTVGPRHSGHI